jgi:hypothetical protein
MRTITVQQRRRAMVRRHHLAGDASDPEAATQAVVALHATDPASVYLSVLARSAASTLTRTSQSRRSICTASPGSSLPALARTMTCSPTR